MQTCTNMSNLYYYNIIKYQNTNYTKKILYFACQISNHHDRYCFILYS